MMDDPDADDRPRAGARPGRDAGGGWLLPRLVAGALAMLAMGVALLVGLIHAGLAALFRGGGADGRRP